MRTIEQVNAAIEYLLGDRSDEPTHADDFQTGYHQGRLRALLWVAGMYESGEVKVDFDYAGFMRQTHQDITDYREAYFEKHGRMPDLDEMPPVEEGPGDGRE